MKLSLWYGILKDWLQAQVTIGTWTLNEPDPLETVALIAPITDVEWTLPEDNRAEILFTQNVYISRGYAKAPYDTLPLPALHGILQTLAIRILHDFKDINDNILEIKWVETPEPVTVRQHGERQDWIATLTLSFQVKAIADPEVGQVQPPYNLVQLIAGIHRAELDNLDNHVLDVILTLPT